MPTIPCQFKADTCLPCPADDPILNVSAEAPDVDRYLSRFSFLNSIPPIRQYPDFDEQGGGIFIQVGCMRWCWSTISQDDADDCARRQAIECAFSPLIPGVPIPTPESPNRISLFSNEAVTGTYACPDGSLFSYTVAAGTVVALTQGEANVIAFSIAQQRARSHRVCISGTLDPICVDTWSTQQITATGPNVAVFPSTDRWELVSGTVPPGMVLETGFTSDGISLSGIPTAIGSYDFRVRVTISTFGSPGFGDFMEKTITVKIVGINESSPLPDATLATPYNQQLTAAFSTDVAGEAWSVVSGNLPDGLTMDEHGLISGTPTGALAGYSFTAQVFYFVGGVKALCAKNMTITAVTPVPQPFAYWEMEEGSGSNREDAVGSLDLSPFGAVLNPSVTGIIDNAAELDAGVGAGGLRRNNEVGFLHDGNGFTLCGWAMLPSYEGFPQLANFCELTYIVSPGNVFFDAFQLFAPADSFPGAGAKFKFGFYRNSGSQTIETGQDFDFNTWYFFRAWYDPLDQKMHLQINHGAILDSSSFALTVGTNNASFGISSNLNIMRIDELGYWKEVLNDAAAAALYNAGAGSRPPLP